MYDPPSLPRRAFGVAMPEDHMLIHRIAAQLYTAEALQTVEAGLDAGEDVTLARA